MKGSISSVCLQNINPSRMAFSRLPGLSPSEGSVRPWQRSSLCCNSRSSSGFLMFFSQKKKLVYYMQANKIAVWVFLHEFWLLEHLALKNTAGSQAAHLTLGWTDTRLVQNSFWTCFSCSQAFPDTQHLLPGRRSKCQSLQDKHQHLDAPGWH